MVPIANDQRIQTDIFCTIVTAIWAVAMLGVAIAVLDLEKLQKMTYPTDQQGRHCTLDNPNYNYLYFTSLHDPVPKKPYSKNASVYHRAPLAPTPLGWTAGPLTSFRVRPTLILSFR